MAVPDGLRFRFGNPGELDWKRDLAFGPNWSQLLELPRSFVHGQVVKDLDYLLDNVSIVMLSEVRA